MSYSPHQLAPFAHRLRLRGSADSMDRVARSILADEVGLDKDIETGPPMAESSSSEDLKSGANNWNPTDKQE